MTSGCVTFRNNVPIRINGYIADSESRCLQKTLKTPCFRGIQRGRKGVLADEWNKKLLRYDYRGFQAQERAVHAKGSKSPGEYRLQCGCPF